MALRCVAVVWLRAILVGLTWLLYSSAPVEGVAFSLCGGASGMPEEVYVAVLVFGPSLDIPTGRVRNTTTETCT
jgi:hypothetical protein